MKLLIICLMTLLLCVSVAAANEFTEGRDTNSVQAVKSLEGYAKYKMGQYKEAREIWLELAELDNATAMINLANLYEQGQGVDQDYKQSNSWLEKAAALNDPRAQFQLGMAYEKGTGVERNPQRAAEWFEKAAINGDMVAQFNLGVMLATNYGEGHATSSPTQREKATSWLKKADENGHTDAAEFLKVLATLQ
ncbi:MAG: hypothetical protein A6F71_00340 [Cycloclasticus sp. symbiont of Poecilosclerida sp. M]|nr:MAG: hypothetical protein A6F71_00340 [Cycloclasticus sp. symbiont of Poecilosclerida sp. M]